MLSLKKDSDQDVFLTEEQVEYILCSLKVISLQMKEFAKIGSMPSSASYKMQMMASLRVFARYVRIECAMYCFHHCNKR